MKATVDIKDTANSRDESRRLRVLWWRPTADRKSAARPRGSVPKRGRPSSRSATHQSCAAKRASKASQPATAPFVERRKGAPKPPDCVRNAVERGMPEPRAGRPHVEPTDVYSCPSQEGGYSARGSREGESKEGGVLRTVHPSTAPRTKPMVWRHGPRLDMEASGLTHRSAQHLTPLRGRPLPEKEEAMEREGAEVSALRPKLKDQGSTFGPMTRPRRSHPMAT